MIERIKEPGFDVEHLSLEDKIKLIRESDGILSGLLEGMKIKEHLYLKGCRSLVSLPKNLKIGGDLILAMCKSLKELSKGLEVGEDMSLIGCSALIELPADLKVSGDLYVWGCHVNIPDGVVKGQVIR